MANMKMIVFLFFSTIFLFSAFHQIKADSSYADDIAPEHSIHESELEEKLCELTTKDETIKQMENIIQEKSAAILSLQNDMQEVQVAYLRKETESLSLKRDVLESRASIAEEKVSDLNSKLESLKKIRDEQKIKIRKIELALQVAEEKVLKAKLQESKILKELKEAQQSWVPHWLSIHYFRLKSILSTQWEDRGRPALDTTLKKLQTAIQEMLRNNELMKPFATDKNVRYLASALMALLIFFLCNLVSSIFRKKPKKRSRNSHTAHRHRRAKQVHVEY